jgi:uncharacterized membrane protein
MKKIKIILGVITALVVIFFATGLIVKETTYTASVTVNKPLKEVFQVFNDISKIKNWIPELKSLEVVEEKLGKTGSVYKMVVTNQGQEITMTEKVLAYVPNEKIVLFFDAENMLKRDEYVFVENESKTTITLQASCKSDSFIMACLFPYFKGVFKDQDQSYLNNFKAYIEK